VSTIETFDGTVHKVSDDHVGIVPKLDENVYHAHPALSSTQARELLDAPARYLFNREHPRVAKREFDVGSAAHSKVLGVGWPIAVIPANLLSADGGIRTAEAKQWVAAARGRGEIPIKQVDADAVNLMAESILANQTARALLEMPGVPEASVFGVDPVTGIHTRCRFDYLADERGGRACSSSTATSWRSDEPRQRKLAVCSRSAARRTSGPATPPASDSSGPRCTRSTTTRTASKKEQQHEHVRPRDRRRHPHRRRRVSHQANRSAEDNGSRHHRRG